MVRPKNNAIMFSVSFVLKIIRNDDFLCIMSRSRRLE